MKLINVCFIVKKVWVFFTRSIKMDFHDIASFFFLTNYFLKAR